MNLVKLIEFLRQRLPAVKLACLAVLAVVALIDIFLVGKEGAHTSAEHIWAFWSLYGFGACVAIVLLSKWFGHAGIMTREDYYDDREEAAEAPVKVEERHGH